MPIPTGTSVGIGVTVNVGSCVGIVVCVGIRVGVAVGVWGVVGVNVLVGGTLVFVTITTLVAVTIGDGRFVQATEQIAIQKIRTNFIM